MNMFIHHYMGFNIHPSTCRVYFKVIDDIYYFCFEDMSVGTSVTNASEQLATEMTEKYGLEPGSARFFETYYYPGEERTFDEIEYTWVGLIAENPRWKPSNEQSLFEF